jgi:hypothetical protein
MSRQLITKEILIVGDSNVQRHLVHSGKYYFQQSDCKVARNLEEFATAITSISAEKYKMVIFAMLTNIVVTAGNTSPGPLASRLISIEACLKSLIETIRSVYQNFSSHNFFF